MSHYDELPDYMDYDVLNDYFVAFLKKYTDNTNKSNIYYALEELLELSDRQWNTYRLISNEIKIQLEKYILSIINFDDEMIIDYILCIIPRIGLDISFNHIQKMMVNINNPYIKDKIEKAILEYGDSVSNPYSGM